MQPYLAATSQDAPAAPPPFDLAFVNLQIEHAPQPSPHTPVSSLETFQSPFMTFLAFVEGWGQCLIICATASIRPWLERPFFTRKPCWRQPSWPVTWSWALTRVSCHKLVSSRGSLFRKLTFLSPHVELHNLASHSDIDPILEPRGHTWLQNGAPGGIFGPNAQKCHQGHHLGAK